MNKMALVAAALLATAIAPGCNWERSADSRPGRSGPGLALPETQRLVQTREAESPHPSPIPAAPAEPQIPSTIKPYMSIHPKPVPIPQTPEQTGRVATKETSAQTPASPAPNSAAKPKKERSEKKSVAVQQHRIAQKALTLAQIRQKYADYFKVAGAADGNKIALTFDDGPDDKFTAQVLDVLRNNNVKATFFVVGFRAEARPDLVARMVREGHIVGNHSYNHALLTKMSVPNFEKQVESTQSVIQRLTGYEPRLFRPPYGAVNEEQVQWAASHRFLIVNWNVDSLDWKGLSAERVSSNILTTAKAGSIILQHCGGGEGEDLSGTVRALPIVIQKLRDQGYQFVTVPELLHVTKNK
jgi:peptidoglycan/xylan/chitin deacetylase (PgdA/CDA1 family)